MMNQAHNHNTGENFRQARIQWDPAKSDAVEKVTKALVQKYISGELRDEIRPAVLQALGEEFSLFYHAAFHRENRPEWAKEKYPEGWKTFVDELKLSLSQQGISVLDSRRDVPRYRRLPADQRETIKVFQELVELGEIRAEDAVNSLARNFGIELSENQVKTYFGSVFTRSEREVESLDNRARVIAGQIEELKKELGLNFSPVVFLQGLVFESTVGCFLAHSRNDDRVERQVRLPIAYHDFEGGPHSEVYLDFKINFEVFEVKLRNNYKNIITSALAQVAALESLTEQEEKINVIYRRPCPLFRVAYDENIRIVEDATQLGLNTLSFADRRLQDVVNYVAASDLFAQDLKSGPVFERFLQKFETQLQDLSADRLKDLLYALERIGSSGTDIPQKIETLTGQLEESRLPTKQMANRLFGEPESETNDERLSLERRIKIIHKQLSSLREKMLCEIYGDMAECAPPARLSEEVVYALEECAKKRPKAFQTLVLNYLALKEEQTVRRLAERTGSSLNEEKEVIRAYDLIRERRAEERYEYSQKLPARWEGILSEHEIDLSRLRVHLPRILDMTKKVDGSKMFRTVAAQLNIPPKLVAEELDRLLAGSAASQELIRLHLSALQESVTELLINEPFSGRSADPSIENRLAGMTDSLIRNIPVAEDIYGLYPNLKKLSHRLIDQDPARMSVYASEVEQRLGVLVFDSARIEARGWQAILALHRQLAVEHPALDSELSRIVSRYCKQTPHGTALNLLQVDNKINEWFSKPESTAELDRRLGSGSLFQLQSDGYKDFEFLLPIFTRHIRGDLQFTKHITAPLVLAPRFEDGADSLILIEQFKKASPDSRLSKDAIQYLETIHHTMVSQLLEEGGYVLAGVFSDHRFDHPDGRDRPVVQSFRLKRHVNWPGESKTSRVDEKNEIFLALLDRYGYLSEMILADYLKRKVDQARSLNYFGNDIAVEYLRESIPPADGPRFDARAFRRWLEPYRVRSDEMFRDLLCEPG